MVEGASFQYTNYNKKGKNEGVVSYKVTDVTTTGNSTSATMSIDLKDEKGNPKGTQIKGPIAREVLERWPSVAKIASIVV